ncbi:MAG TPA: BTAD domain-containing putative transcriptional regulator [Dermatophilaceae bacterium]|nr:BTAD domain-containing putative transcriptional regulator [Dermatophilaceae bacterium]
MRVGVLGPLVLDGDARALGPRDRVVLGVLVLHLGSAVRTDTLAEALWGEQPPASATKVVQGCVLRLRRTLGAEAVETMPSGGYRLRLHHDDVDVTVFEDLLTRARGLLAGGQPDRARYAVQGALALWRGDPFSELEDWEAASAVRERLKELHSDAEEVRAEAELACGGHAEVRCDLQRLVDEQPTRERRWALLALAEYRCGRQADALRTLRRARRRLVEELGLDPGEELTDLEGAVLRHDPALAAPSGQSVPTGCPYPGLLSFDVEDSASFFGRETEVATAMQTLDRVGALVVVGPSGSGKSSLLRAGVAAALRRDGARVHVLTPGSDPRTAWGRLGVVATDVVVVDQLEEALAPGVQDVDGFVADLAAFVHDGGRLVMGVRGDRLDELGGRPALARLAERGLRLLGPMTVEDLVRAIVGPADQAGLRLEPGLVDLLVREVEGQPAALPLLSHVLRETWSVREGRTLTVAGYRSTGGVRGAVARTAETLFHDLDTRAQSLLAQLMTRLVSTGEDGAPLRRRVPRRSLDQDADRHVLVERLIAARLLSTDREMVEIAHESLTSAWPRLRSWLDEDVDGLRIMRHLAVAAESWAQLGRPGSELYRGARLSRAVEWRQRAAPHLAPVESAFLGASVALDEAERSAAAQQAQRDRTVNRRLRAGLVATVALAVVAITAGALASAASRRADSAATAADARRLGAEALRAGQLDTALLLSVAGLRLSDLPDTRANLLATLDQAATLVRSARVPIVVSQSVHRQAGTVLAQAPKEGLLVRRADTLEPLARHADLRGPAVVTAPDGSMSAVTVMPELAAAPGGRPVVLLNGEHEVAADQLGGIPPGTFAQQDISVSPDSRWLAVTLREEKGEGEPVVAVWDLTARSRPAAVLRLGAQWHNPLVQPGGLVLWSSGDGVVRRTDLRDARVASLLTAPDLDVGRLEEVQALSPDGSLLAVGAGSELLLVDTATSRPRHVLPASGGVHRAAFSADGSTVAASGDALTVWDLGGEQPIEVLAQEDGGDWPAFDADGRTLFTSVFEGRLLAWDLGGDRGFLPTVGGSVARPAAMVRLSPNATRVVRVGDGPRPWFSVVDVASGRGAREVGLRQDLTTWLDVAWSADGALVSVSTGDDVVSVWDSRSLTEVARRPVSDGEGVVYAAFTPDGALLAGTSAGRLHVLDQRTLAPRRDPIEVAPPAGDDDAGVLSSMAVRPGTAWVAVGVDGDGWRLVDTSTGRVLPLDLGADVFGLAWSPDGDRLAVTTDSGGVGLYDLTTRSWVAPLTTRQPFAGSDLRFAPDGSEWATVAAGRVGRWDGGTGAFLGAVTVGSGGTVGYDERGALLVAQEDGPIRRWDLDPGGWVRTACAMAGRELTEAEWRDHLPNRDFRPVCRPAAVAALPRDPDAPRP